LRAHRESSEGDKAVKKLLRKRTLLVVVSSVAVVAAAALGASAARGDDSPNPPRGDALVADINSQIGADPNKSQDIGQVSRIRKGVFAFGAGDPVDVDLLAGKGGVRCLAVSGEAYPSSVGCFLMKDAAKDGSYQVVMPLGDAPVLVVGYAPMGSRGSKRRRAVRRARVSCETRCSWQRWRQARSVTTTQPR
jgi:hypothetical protein